MNKNILKNLTSKPGIYKMLDQNNKILYIGKASNLRKRVSSYFVKGPGSIKTNKLVEKIKNVDVIITNNEQEALILENSLIKKIKPRYNILLRDDKSYPYIFVDTEHKFPLIKFYRGDKKPLGRYFGPYTQANNLRKTLNLVQKIFKVRQCENSYFKTRKKPCLQYQINRCSAPCVKFINQADYQDSINNSILFLQGKSGVLINSYTKKMNQLSAKKEYEKASVMRDKVTMIRKITQSPNIILDKGNYDIATISTVNNKSCIDVFMIRDGINLGNKPFIFTNKQDSNEISLLNAFLKQYYLKNLPPERVLVSIKLPDYLLLEKVVLEKYEKKIKIIIPNKKIDKSYLKICQESTDSRARQSSLSSSSSNILYSLSKDLKSKRNIKNIICFDVSHISGSNMVGSSVWYNSNGPEKNLYRRYNLEKIQKANDYEGINYIIKRRLTSLLKDKKMPDMILVDGGKGQITQAKSVIKDLLINNIIVFGIVKGESRHSKNDRVIDINNNDITNNLRTENMKILQTIRDEAHRFAIMTQRKKSSKQHYHSKLDKIPGIGEKRKHQILQYFGGIQATLKSSINELQNVPGINKSLAEIIYHHLQK